MTVYIFTRGRTDRLLKSVPRWREQGLAVRLIVEPSEFAEHTKLRDDRLWDHVSVLSLPEANAGMGFARSFAVHHANHKGYKSIIVSDDDIRPAVGSDMSLLLEEARKPGVLGVGAVHSLHDRFTGGAITANKGNGVILCPGGWGFTLYGLNVINALHAGNFDTKLDAFGEDAELERQGISRLGIPWAVHCDVWADYFSKRGDPGGMSDLCPGDGERAARETACRKIIHERWPAFASAPEAKPRMAWQKFLNSFIPDWRARSAMHGGRW